VKRLVRFVLDHIPALQTRLHAWIHRATVAHPRRYYVPLDKHDLSPRMQAEYSELEQYVKARKR
jgi:3',5'-cyclic AMP phosphodiesterase CpdA